MARCCHHQSFPPALSAPAVEAQRPPAAPSNQAAASSVRRYPFQPRQGPLEPPGQPCPAARPPAQRRRQPRPQAQQHPPATEPEMDSQQRAAASPASLRRSRHPSTSPERTPPQENPRQQTPALHQRLAILLPHQAFHLNHLWSDWTTNRAALQPPASRHPAAHPATTTRTGHRQHTTKWRCLAGGSRSRRRRRKRELPAHAGVRTSSPHPGSVTVLAGRSRGHRVSCEYLGPRPHRERTLNRHFPLVGRGRSSWDCRGRRGVAEAQREHRRRRSSQ